MFIDTATIMVKGGNGGRGAATFHREKYVPKGGPDGGNGGNGGSVVLEATPHENTLMRYKYNRHFRAENGVNGAKKNCHGRRGENLVLKVPIGTVVRDSDTGVTIADLDEEGATCTVALGGRGGHGNLFFKCASRPVPTFAELGEPGEDKTILLEMKLMADVGLVGFPNAGKSTFLGKISNARPKVADYPFTTVNPMLGVANLDMDRSLVIADLPGLIEGAAEGLGLGHRFLRHIERTGVVLHLIDMEDVDLENPLERYEAIRQELERYSDKLASKPEVVAFSKMEYDLGEDMESLIRASFGEREVHFISSFTGKGINELIERLWNLCREYREQLDSEPVIPVEQ